MRDGETRADDEPPEQAGAPDPDPLPPGVFVRIRLVDDDPEEDERPEQ